MRLLPMMNPRRRLGAKRFGPPCFGLGVMLSAVSLVAAFSGAAFAAEAGATSANPHPYGAWSLIPPLLAIVLAIATRRIHLSLLAGVAAGALIVASGNPVTALAATCESYLWPSLADGDHLRVMVFTLLMAAMVGVISASGGMRGLVNLMAPRARSRAGGQVTGWGLGMLVFFDDYANTLLLGTTLRPVTDRLRVSREKLAYIVDSTAAPVAGLAPLSSWVAIEISYIDSGYASLVQGGMIPKGSYSAFDLFLTTIPYRFYPLLALAFVPLVALMRRDFGPMLLAERKAQQSAAPNADTTSPADASTSDQPPARWYNALAPIGVVLSAVVVLILVTGWKNLGDWEPTFWNMFTQGDSYIGLMYGALLGLLTIVVMSRWQNLLTWEQIRQVGLAGAAVVVPALAILWLAWSLQLVVKGDLRTAEYIGDLMRGAVSPALMPTLVFLFSAAVAFATGTSWGTMAILTPIVIGVTFDLVHHPLQPTAIDQPILLASIGAVLAGSIFGDHCSPISDTTVLSSAASGCDHVAHVWTQMPYAIVVGLAAIVCGTLPAGLMEVSPWGCVVCLVVGCVLLGVFLRVFGRRADEEPERA